MLAEPMAKAQAKIDPRAACLDPSEWGSYFQAIGCGEALLASVVLGTPAAARHGAVARPLLGIAYDKAAQALTVRVGENSERPFLRYFVSGPRSIEVHEDDHGKVIVVVDVSGACTLIHIVSRPHHAPAISPGTATAERGEPPV
jgi:hypothetical protein